MYARVSRFQENADLIDEATRQTQEKIVPQIEKMPGFLGLVSLADRKTGATLSVTYWESEDAMRASEADADRLREEAARLGDGQVSSVERYEVVLRVNM